MDNQKLIIIGSGPAGYTAAIYAARANLNPILYEGFFSGPPGGQLMTTTDVDNFPGFPDGITGPELMESMRKQAIRFGTTIITEDVKSVELGKRPFKVFGSKTHHETESIIIATGATAKKLDIPGAGEGELWQKGVTACAVCDGAMPIFRDKELFVIGGGDTACEEALFLTKYGSKVFMIHRRDELRASKIMQEQVLNHPKVKVFWNSECVQIKGKEVVEEVVIKDVFTGQETTKNAAGVFFAIGHRPNTSFLGSQIELDPSGYIIVKGNSTLTSIDGIFAAGDVQDKIYRQAVSAAGSGCMAALDAERWLSHNKKS